MNKLFFLILGFLFLPQISFGAVLYSQYKHNSDTIGATGTGTAGIVLNCDSYPSTINSISIRGSGNGSQKFVGYFSYGNSVSDTQWFPSGSSGIATRTFTFSPAISCVGGSGDIYLKGNSTTTSHRLGYFSGYGSDIDPKTFCSAGGGVDYVVGYGTCGNAWDWTYEIDGEVYVPPGPSVSTSTEYVLSPELTNEFRSMNSFSRLVFSLILMFFVAGLVFTGGRQFVK